MGLKITIGIRKPEGKCTILGCSAPPSDATDHLELMPGSRPQ